MTQIDNNLTSCFLAAARLNVMLAGGQGGRIVNARRGLRWSGGPARV
jgi:hypothetical protein